MRLVCNNYHQPFVNVSLRIILSIPLAILITNRISASLERENGLPI
ncbi:Protein of unknown function [Pyronema omphalodes CBS 100304]|uniref:Uncharacterized protein n=1 Tax=Pyronema omphalodes (strain CBS 100304) TaxID=1076935 RepID=U4L4D4_PYROM|nr:Protein of unknown function [Pyronema omphalodes CBS 100304]